MSDSSSSNPSDAELVARLKAAREGKYAGYLWDLCGEAADAIERLARELQGTEDELYSVDKAAKELGAERDRLRAALERLTFGGTWFMYSPECEAAIEQAREALAGAGDDK